MWAPSACLESDTTTTSLNKLDNQEGRAGFTRAAGFCLYCPVCAQQPVPEGSMSVWETAGFGIGEDLGSALS